MMPISEHSIGCYKEYSTAITDYAEIRQKQHDARGCSNSNTLLVNCVEETNNFMLFQKKNSIAIDFMLFWKKNDLME